MTERVLYYDDPEYGNGSLVELRAEAAKILGDLTKTPEERVRLVVNIFPGGNHHYGPTEWIKAHDLAMELQDRSPIINCGACYKPEECVAYKRCRRR